MIRRASIACGLALCVASIATARAQKKPAAPTPPAATGTKPTIALFRVEPLGLDSERAARLEALFRIELERLHGAPMPSRVTVERAVAGDPALRGCAGEVDCLTAIGKKLAVKQIVSGNVGELGDSYVLNLKLVDVDAGTEVRRVSEPLRGNPDELIEAMRVAAYRLVDPEALKGSVAILSDVAGAQVFLDGKSVGKTPLAKPIANVPIGPHKLRITAAGYTDFLSDVEVRFQKSTQVVVRMVAAKDPGIALVAGGPPRPAEVPWYSTGWAYAGVAVGAILIGVLVGQALAEPDVIDCSETPCMP